MSETRLNRIATVMVDRGVDNVTLANYIGKTRETVSLYRHNKVQPSLKVLFKIAECLRVHPGDLLVAPSWVPQVSYPSDLAKPDPEQSARKKTRKSKK